MFVKYQSHPKPAPFLPFDALVTRLNELESAAGGSMNVWDGHYDRIGHAAAQNRSKTVLSKDAVLKAVLDFYENAPA